MTAEFTEVEIGKGVYAGLDVSLDAVAICVIRESGEVLWQGGARRSRCGDGCSWAMAR
jgi:hypothetical protein